MNDAAAPAARHSYSHLSLGAAEARLVCVEEGFANARRLGKSDSVAWFEADREALLRRLGNR